MIEPQKWTSTLGSLSDTVTLPDEDLQFASFKKLFPALTQVPLSEGGVAPQRTDFNTLFKLLGDNIFYIQQGGVFSYSNTADYEMGSFVKYNNELYLCIQANGASSTVKAPTETAYWSKIPTLADLDEISFKTGDIKIHTTSTVPNGWLLCNGSAVSRTTFSALFAKIGTTYGTGNGSTTFNIPDLRDRYIIGANTNALGTQIAEQLPNILGVGGSSSGGDALAGDMITVKEAFSGSTRRSYSDGTYTTVGSRTLTILDFKASNSNSTYTNSGHVYPLSLALNFIIKC